jgi:hypothetical protein
LNALPRGTNRRWASDSGPDDFDPVIGVALAYSKVGDGTAPPAGLRRRILEAATAPALPRGFRIERASEDTWQPHPVPGIRMKVLSIDHTRLSATLVLDVAPGIMVFDAAPQRPTDDNQAGVQGGSAACIKQRPQRARGPPQPRGGASSSPRR